ncbi:CAP domain-containing protein [Bradyrhizobium archetypum]
MAGSKTVILARQALLLGLVICFAAVGGRTAAANPAQMISDFRLKHGEKRVTLDATLTRIAHDQAQAMAAKDQLDHDVLGRFNTRVSPAGAGRAAENIAYGYESFPKTLDQWINSSGHRKNLLLPGATRVGVASVKSAKTGRTYWAMVIAGDYERPKPKASPKSPSKESKQANIAKPKSRAAESCRLKILSLCL